MANESLHENLKSMSLGDHLEELRWRMILALLGIGVGLIIAFWLGDWFLHLIVIPFENAMQKAGQEPRLQAIKVAEKFLVYLKACFILAIVITSPWVFYQIWAFISAGLYRREKKYIYAVVPASALLFVSGCFFFLFIVAPLALRYFVSFDTGIDFVNYQPSLTEYVNFILSLTLVFGLAFQMPIAIVFAERMGLITVRQLSSSRKYVILGAAFIAAVATPPDVISQIALAIPLYILYEGSILTCIFLNRRKKK